MQMKFSAVRKKERKDKKNLQQLLKELTSLNSNIPFEEKEGSMLHIRSGLSAEDLTSISLPVGASFLRNPKKTVREHGFLLVGYKDNEYLIFPKEFKGVYLAF